MISSIIIRQIDILLSSNITILNLRCNRDEVFKLKIIILQTVEKESCQFLLRFRDSSFCFWIDICFAFFNKECMKRELFVIIRPMLYLLKQKYKINININHD